MKNTQFTFCDTDEVIKAGDTVYYIYTDSHFRNTEVKRNTVNRVGKKYIYFNHDGFMSPEHEKDSGFVKKLYASESECLKRIAVDKIRKDISRFHDYSIISIHLLCICCIFS